MRASTPFGGGECCAPLFEKCPQHHWHKGDPGVTSEICGAIGEEGPSDPSVGEGPGALGTPLTHRD